VFWTDDADNPYSTPADRPFYWFRARQVGGKSIIWGRQVYRWSDLDFEANLRDGLGRGLADSLPGHRALVRTTSSASSASAARRSAWRSCGRPVPPPDAAETASSGTCASGCRSGSVAIACSRSDGSRT